MATPLTAEESVRYTSIVDAILATADLQTVTRKKIRQGLEKALGGKDLSDQKDAIKTLIEERFDAISNQEPVNMPTPPTIPAPSSDAVRPSPKRSHDEIVANGHSPEEDGTSGEGEILVSPLPPAKKAKRESEEADARLAAELQAQEDRLALGRTTRGGSASKPVKKKTPRKKSKAVVGDSDTEGSDQGKKRKAGGGFQKPFNLSYPLAELCGAPQLSRPQVVKKIWEHIKANELQDPSDKRQIRCDDKMQAVFKQSRVDMFQMNKLLGNQLYPVEE